MAEEIKKTEKVADKVNGEAREGGLGHKVNQDKKSEVESKEAAPKKVKKKAKKRHLTEANVCVQVSFNNTIVTVTDMKGDTVCWASSGSCGFKGTRKATPYAASVAVENALTKAKAMGVEKVHVTMKGTGAGRDQSLRAINAAEVSIESISDITAIAHNGCRARKARRI